LNKPLLVIGNKNYSSWSLRPWLMLKHAGIDFDELRIPLFVPGSTEQLSIYSPSGLVPVYIESGMTVWDTLAIGEYLYESHSELWPDEPATRAVARSVSAEMHSGFSTLRKMMPMNIRAKGRKVASTADLEAEIGRIKTIWRALRTQHATKGPWLFGQYSIADAMFAPVVFRFLSYGVSEVGAVDDYILTVSGDPLIQTWVKDSANEKEIISQNEVGR
jgi:glutathione S-transferase